MSGIIVSASAAMSAAVVADVKSLTSDEMTETYIKDSTIIVTPGKRKKNQAADNKRKLTTLTISPGKAEKSEADEHYEFEQMTSQQASRIDSAMTFADIEAAQQNLIRQQQTAMMPAPDIKLIMPERPMPDIPGFEEFLESGVTERNFNYTPLLGGSGIEIERVDNQLIMGFGDLKGVDTIQVPRAIDEGPVQLTPRPGGGFDLVIEIPQN
ncbi:MAG: hypothetical protein CSA50_07220 [Gammaproteobacteria bacterium]|nr:MAG: hypothetical protein CSA50_07220 [Gammaproteobacteria bacterium]